MQKGHQDIGQSTEIRKAQFGTKDARSHDFVLEKSIFNNVFGKDIRRIYIYKKAERLAKAVHLVAPAFADSPSLRSRIDTIALGLVDAAILPPGVARSALSQELLALSSVLGMARIGGSLSAMNADLIGREAHSLLQEVASYEEPRISFDESPTLSDIARLSPKREAVEPPVQVQPSPRKRQIISKGHQKDIIAMPDVRFKDRRDAILAVLKDKPRASIKDISTLIRDVSEKTIQRELMALVSQGVVVKQGERRWSTYSIS